MVESFTLCSVPVEWLLKVSILISIGQVLHLELPQGLLPGVFLLLEDEEVRSARTRRSLRFLGLRKAIIGGSGNSFSRRYDA